MDVDAAHQVAKGILDEAAGRISAIRTEEDAKVQLITRILVEVLGWKHSDISSETPNKNGFSDYVISENGHVAFVLEAKKIGAIEIATHSSTKGHYKISGPVLKPATEGINQVAAYCHPIGAPLAVLTDGMLWVVFLPWVPQASFADRQAIVFPSIEALLNDFSLFYELLSRSHSTRSTYRVIFDSIHENRLVLERELTAPIAQVENAIVQKSGLAFDLERVFSSFFSGLAGDSDPDMLVECFVETRESRLADFSLERLTKNVLGNINPAERDVGEGLRAVVHSTVAGDAGQTVFIVGPSGAGKSTFLERFFVRTLTPEIRQQCVVINVDALDASGDDVAALPWMTERAISAIEKQLFDDGIPDWNQLQALFHLEYVKRAKGVDSALYERNKVEFKEKFAKYVDEQVERDREGYLRKLLSDVVRNRKKLPVFVIDNTDEFGLTFKTSIFQYFQALRRSVGHCLLIFPATDRSAWTFSRTEIFNIYSSKSFFLPTPSPREVFRKRIDYLRGKIDESKPTRKASEYIASRGIRVSIRDITAFASVIETIFVNQDYAAKRVGELSNYNMRKALGLSKRIITSSVLNIEDIIKSYFTGALVAPSAMHFSNALARGDYQFFRPGDEPLIFPAFQVDINIRQSPLMSVRVLTLLNELDYSAKEDIERYMTVNSIYAYFGVMAVPEVATQRTLESLLASGLVEPYDLSEKGYSDTQRLAITFSGSAHLDLAMSNPVFFEQFALTSRITDTEIAAQIRGAYFASGARMARMEEVREIFARYLCEEDSRHCNVPVQPEFSSQAAIRDELLARWTSKKWDADEIWRVPDIVGENVRGVIENFDHFKGFGFVDLPSLRESAFLHARIVEQGNFPDVHDGDEITCDVTRTDKGLAISKLHGVNSPAATEGVGVIVKLFPDRRYGFINVPSMATDAFFHYHLFPPDKQKALFEGQNLKVEVLTDKEGKAQVRRVL